MATYSWPTATDNERPILGCVDRTLTLFCLALDPFLLFTPPRMFRNMIWVPTSHFISP